MNITKPHDSFTRAFLAPEGRALEILAFALKDFRRKGIPRGVLKRKDASRLSPELKQYFPDLLFDLSRGKDDQELVILFEHKSSADRYLPVQLLSYMANLMKESCFQKKGLVPVVPVVIYHGREKLTEKNLPDYFENSEAWWKKCLPRFKYYVIDLRALSRETLEKEFQQNVYIKIALITLKYIFYPEKLEFILLDMLNSNRFDTKEGEEFICHLFVYLLSALGDKHRTRIYKRALRALNTQLRRKVMTIAESLIHEGEEIGLKRGEIIGEKRGALKKQQEILIKQLSKKYGLSRYEKGFIRAVKSWRKLDKALIAFADAAAKEEILSMLK